MRQFIFGACVVVVLGVVGVVVAKPMDQMGLLPLIPKLTDASSRACMFPAGGWAIVNCSNAAAASSAALNEWSRYVIQCGVNSYIATGTAAAGQDADTNDGYLPAGAWLEFMTTDTVKYISCLNIGSDSDCRLLECQ